MYHTEIDDALDIAMDIASRSVQSEWKHISVREWIGYAIVSAKNRRIELEAVRSKRRSELLNCMDLDSS